MSLIFGRFLIKVEKIWFSTLGWLIFLYLFFYEQNVGPRFIGFNKTICNISTFFHKRGGLICALRVTIQKMFIMKFVSVTCVNVENCNFSSLFQKSHDVYIAKTAKRQH